MNKLLFLLVTAGFLATQCHQGSSEPAIKVRQDLFNTSMRDSVTCYRIPSIVTAPNGDLVVAIDERRESCADLYPNKNIDIVIRRSEDNGKTWTPIQTVVDFPYGEAGSDPSMIVDGATGDIFLFYNYMNNNTGDRIYNLQYVKSSDCGQTWSESVDITSQITPAEWEKDFKFITSGRGTYTRDGKMLHTLVNLNRGLHLIASDDHGQTWYRIETAIQPADESKVIELSDGRWMINSRVNDKKGTRYVHISSDQGKTWNSYRETQLTDPGCNAGIVSYTYEKKGKTQQVLLFSHANDPTERKNLTVHISYDDGVTWSEGKVIYEGEAAYSSITMLPNGDVAVFYEKDNYTKNEVVVFPIEYLMQ
ncbi:MAG TPA: sialidase family protein [Bacteroidales bacterium]|nr:sialidase family protein [Bacteroidales bacterium]HQB56654.1 sialidase family protein [Bacteroidales bacterium]